jgi:phosphohistidine swiveling domain-containing protein
MRQDQPHAAANAIFQLDSPEEAAHLWTVDLMHWPNGISPLGGTMSLPAFMRGATKASRELHMPFTAFNGKVIHGYCYNSFVPYSTDPDEMQRRMVDMQAQMGKHIPGLLDRWRDEYEPEVRRLNQETLTTDYSTLGDRDLSDLLETIVAKGEREGELHFLAVFPAMGAVQFFESVYTQLFGEPSREEHLDLLQGFPNKSLDTAIGMWNLAQEAKRRPWVTELLAAVEPARIHEALNERAEGRAFRGAVEEFLDEFGWRGSELDIAAVTWREDPANVYTLIQDFAALDGYDPAAEFDSVAAARKQREDQLLAQLSGAGKPVELFQQALAGAQQYLPIQEDHNFWIDQQGTAVYRVPVLAAAQRLHEAGRLEDPSDVFYLHYDELQDALRGGKGDLAATVTHRRLEHEENMKLSPPATLGTPPPMPEGADAPISKFFGGPPKESADPLLINGNPASAGRVTGTARVILRLDDGYRLGQGEILVCPATMPPWTPLFGIASAVVTDHGGVLSHTAIVAREYKIPAVVGAKIATTTIKDGQTITVDGSEGTVKLEE